MNESQPSSRQAFICRSSSSGRVKVVAESRPVNYLFSLSNRGTAWGRLSHTPRRQTGAPGGAQAIPFP